MDFLIIMGVVLSIGVVVSVMQFVMEVLHVWGTVLKREGSKFLGDFVLGLAGLVQAILGLCAIAFLIWFAYQYGIYYESAELYRR